MKREFKQEKDGLTLVTSVVIDKEKEIESLEQNIESVELEMNSLANTLKELVSMRDELKAIEG